MTPITIPAIAPVAIAEFEDVSALGTDDFEAREDEVVTVAIVWLCASTVVTDKGPDMAEGAYGPWKVRDSGGAEGTEK
jgi:hypothetical protein